MLMLFLNQIVGTLVKKGTAKNIVTTVELEDKFPAPVMEGQKLGQVTYSLDNKIVGTTNLVAEKTIDRLTLPNMVSFIFQDWINLLR